MWKPKIFFVKSLPKLMAVPKRSIVNRVRSGQVLNLKLDRSVFRTLSNIYDGAFLKIN